VNPAVAGLRTELSARSIYKKIDYLNPQPIKVSLHFFFLYKIDRIPQPWPRPITGVVQSKVTF
jgi:hypothetical protein